MPPDPDKLVGILCRVWIGGVALLAAAALGVAPALAQGGTIEVGIGPPVGGEPFDGAKTSQVPKCAKRGFRFRPPSPPPRDATREERREIERALLKELRKRSRCEMRVFNRIGHLGNSFIGALQAGNEVRACNLVTKKEQARLGGDACPTSLAGLDHRLRAERDPFIQGYGYDGRSLRGDFDLRLVRPFEKVGMRFEVEADYWRISNVRDLLRQAGPAA